MSMLKKIDLDARGLEHPKPLEEAIKVLRSLENEHYFYMLHRKNPIPLIDLANEQGFNTLSKEDNSGTWHILIAKNTDIALEDLLRV